MKAEVREKLHDIKERVIHPFGHRREEAEGRKAGEKSTHGRHPDEHKIDDIAGSEFLED